MTPADRRRLAAAVIARMGCGAFHRRVSGFDIIDLPDGPSVFLDAGGWAISGRRFHRRLPGRGWVARTTDAIAAAIRAAQEAP